MYISASIYTHIHLYVKICGMLKISTLNEFTGRSTIPRLFNVYTILPSPKWYGVWHTKGMPGGESLLRKSRACDSAAIV